MKIFLPKVLLLIAAHMLSVNLALAQAAPFQGDVPAMVEQAKSAGIIHTYDGPWEYFVGGGAASFDCNGDRMADLLIGGGTNPAKLFINRSTPGGDLKFAAANIDAEANELTKVLGAYPVNIDNDQYTDVVLLRLGENVILKGAADCSFSPANQIYSFDGANAWTTGFSAIWEKDKIFPTLAFANYVDRTAAGTPWGTCENNRLMRPADGKAVADYSQSIALSPGYCALSALFTDWGNSGEPALRLANDRQYYRGGQEQLWRLAANGKPRQFTAGEGWRKLKIWGMGIAQTDLNGDGRPEYAITSMGDTMLQTLDVADIDEGPTYRDMAFDRQMTAHRPYVGGDVKPSTGWHVQFADFNNDAIADVFIAKGNVEAMPDFAAFDPDNMLLGGRHGKFHEKGQAAGIALNKIGRGAVVEDFNADGQLDLLVVNRKQNVSLFRNLGANTDWGHRPMGNWLRIEVDNGDVNTDAIGAKITVKTGNHSQTKTIQIGGGHASGQIGFAHFGLGVAERATIRIQWPNGEKSHQYRAIANNSIIITKGAENPRYWYAVNTEQ